MPAEAVLRCMDSFTENMIGEKSPVFRTQWWNNGTINKRSKECPGEGWVRGRIKTSKKTK